MWTITESLNRPPVTWTVSVSLHDTELRCIRAYSHYMHGKRRIQAYIWWRVRDDVSRKVDTTRRICLIYWRKFVRCIILGTRSDTTSEARRAVVPLTKGIFTLSYPCSHLELQEVTGLYWGNLTTGLKLYTLRCRVESPFPALFHYSTLTCSSFFFPHHRTDRDHRHNNSIIALWA